MTATFRGVDSDAWDKAKALIAARMRSPIAAPLLGLTPGSSVEMEILLPPIYTFTIDPLDGSGAVSLEPHQLDNFEELIFVFGHDEIAHGLLHLKLQSGQWDEGCFGRPTLARYLFEAAQGIVGPKVEGLESDFEVSLSRFAKNGYYAYHLQPLFESKQYLAGFIPVFPEGSIPGVQNGEFYQSFMLLDLV